MSVGNIFRNWLHGIDNGFRMIIRVGALTIYLVAMLCKNVKVVNNKNVSHLHVIYHCTVTLHLWSSLQQVKKWRPIYGGLYAIGVYDERYLF
jgi:hypothetical protein